MILVKEGYLQEKIRELDFKLKQQMALAEQLDKHLQRVIVSEKEQKKMFKKLKQLDEFKETLVKDIEQKNRKEITQSITQSKEVIIRKIDDAIEKNFGQLTKQMEALSDRLSQLESYHSYLERLAKQVCYSEHLCNLIMEELVRERIFTNEKIEILSKRASIRAKDE